MSNDKIAYDGSVVEGLKKERDKEGQYTQTSPEASADDKDALWDQADTAGTELPGSGNETPDQSNVDEIGKATGESYNKTEPLDPTKKSSLDRF